MNQQMPTETDLVVDADAPAPPDMPAAEEPTGAEISRAGASPGAAHARGHSVRVARADGREGARQAPAARQRREELVGELEAHYANRGIHLVRVAGKFAFRTAPDLGAALQIETTVARKLSRAAIETMAIIAYHQPVTRAEIEEIRGVALSRGTLDTLMEAGWVQPRGHRETPGHPATWVTTQEFLSHFGLNSAKDLPGIEELKAAGLLDARPAVSAYSEDGKLGEVKPEAEEQDHDVAAELEPAAAEPGEGEPPKSA